MDINWQLKVVGLIVFGAVAYLVARAVRSWKATRSGCGGSCGCAGKSDTQSATFISSNEITMRK